MYTKSLYLLAAVPLAAAHPQAAAAAKPKTGENGQQGGLFGMGASPSIPKGFEGIAKALGKGVAAMMPNINIDPTSMMYTGPEYPKGKVSLADYYDPGTGPYKAQLSTDPSLPNHVIYAPKVPPPPGVKMPVFLWGNGGCTSSGTPYGMFLTEIASYGYLAIANGPPGGAPPSLDQPRGQMLPGPDGKQIYGKQSAAGNGQSKVQDMLDAQDWVVKGNAKKFGNIDIDNFITGGSSCGGLEAYSASYNNPRVKLVGVYNSGLLDAKKTPLLKELTAKIAYFAGGPKAIEYTNVGCIQPVMLCQC
jgi:hypothetical protein